MVFKLLTGCALALFAQGAAADLTIATWNIQRLGHDNQKSFDKLAFVAEKSDFIAIQEVMTDTAGAKLESALEASSGQPWSRIESDAAGRGSYKERYAFFWNDTKIEYVDGAVSYLDRHDVFEREPFSAKFKELSTSRTFVAATVHILYGSGPQARAPEINQLAQYWSWLGEVYTGTPDIYLMGDFNMPPSDPAWAPLLPYARPLVTKGATTLSDTDGKFVSLYDNVFVSTIGPPESAKAYVLNYPKMIGWTHKKSRKHLSDHAPIFVNISLQESAPAASQQLGKPHVQAAIHSAAKQTQSVPMETAVGIRGNKKSMIFHREDCPSYNRVGVKNRVEFKDAAEAISAGFHLAGNCH
jgi:endonuclease/exonuclease/phosphatase family metal-dependent hydrolase